MLYTLNFSNVTYQLHLKLQGGKIYKGVLWFISQSWMQLCRHNPNIPMLLKYSYSPWTPLKWVWTWGWTSGCFPLKKTCIHSAIQHSVRGRIVVRQWFFFIKSVYFGKYNSRWDISSIKNMILQCSFLNVNTNFYDFFFQQLNYMYYSLL